MRTGLAEAWWARVRHQAEENQEWLLATSNLANCLRFLREKPDQISGVRDRSGAVQPEVMYAEFLERLPSVLPDEVIAARGALRARKRDRIDPE
jgi:hypothetical protein